MQKWCAFTSLHNHPLPQRSPLCAAGMGEYNFDWDNLYWGANSLLASIGAGSTFVGEVEHFLSVWACGDDQNVM